MIKKIVIWVGVFIVCVLLLFLMSKTAGKSVGGTVVPGSDIVNQDDHVNGPSTAKIKLIEYGDYQCPGCAAYAPVIENLKKDFGDQMELVFRNFPLRQHDNAIPAARAAEAAAVQGKFWEMHYLIYEDQVSWESLSNPFDTFNGYAKQLALNLDQFKKDYDSDIVKKKIDDDLNGGLGFGVNSTPSLFLNGKLVALPKSYDVLKSDIQQLIDASAK